MVPAEFDRWPPKLRVGGNLSGKLREGSVARVTPIKNHWTIVSTDKSGDQIKESRIASIQFA